MLIFDRLTHCSILTAMTHHSKHEKNTTNFTLSMLALKK